jgi:hypothetical protein
MRRLFVGPFYRQHAGTFLFLYVLFLGSFLFINYLGEIPASESFFWHFVLLIFMVTQQFMVILFLLLAGFYLLKTRLWIRRLLLQDDYAFLKQSLSVLPRKSQWWVWFKIEVWLSLPLLIYGLACLVMSLHEGVPIYGTVIVFFLLLLVTIVSCVNYRQLIHIPEAKNYRPITSRVPKLNLTKWMIFAYGLVRELPALIITKSATILFTFLMIRWEGEAEMSLRDWWLSFLLIGSAHALLAYRAAKFMESRFPDLWGLPVRQLRGFLFSTARSHLLILLPECLILLLAGYGWLALIGILSEWCILHFYYYFSAYLQFNLKAVLKAGFLLLSVGFLVTLYGFFWLVILGYFVTAYILFRIRYYCLE